MIGYSGLESLPPGRASLIWVKTQIICSGSLCSICFADLNVHREHLGILLKYRPGSAGPRACISNRLLEDSEIGSGVPFRVARCQITQNMALMWEDLEYSCFLQLGSRKYFKLTLLFYIHDLKWIHSQHSEWINRPFGYILVLILSPILFFFSKKITF